MLDWAVEAWKIGGCKWKAWSSRLVTASLHVGKKEIHIVSCYAPTRAARREEKDKFCEELSSNVLTNIPDSDMSVLLGGFNARIGSRNAAQDQRGMGRGPHGHGIDNDAGKELLIFSHHPSSYCLQHMVSIEEHTSKYTWKHPKSQNWYCIDYIVMRQRDMKLCIDAAVKRGPECNTDHQLLRANSGWLGNF